MKSGTAMTLLMFMVLMIISAVQSSIIVDSHGHIRMGGSNLTTSNSTFTINTRQYDRTCFGCVFQGYKYCKNSQLCIIANQSCTGISPSDFFTRSSGCPISDSCRFGINGLVFVSAKNSDNTQKIANSTNPEVANTGSQSITAPADKPCVIGFVNY